MTHQAHCFFFFSDDVKHCATRRMPPAVILFQATHRILPAHTLIYPSQHTNQHDQLPFRNHRVLILLREMHRQTEIRRNIYWSRLWDFTKCYLTNWTLAARLIISVNHLKTAFPRLLIGTILEGAHLLPGHFSSVFPGNFRNSLSEQNKHERKRLEEVIFHKTAEKSCTNVLVDEKQHFTN